MSDYVNPDDVDAEDDEYFSEVLEDAELTGKEPKFVGVDSLFIEPSVMASMKVDELVGVYIAARNQLATDRKGYKAREAKIKLHMNIISMLLRDKADELGVDNFKTSLGTAYRNFKSKFGVADWATLSDYVQRTGFFHILQKRVSPNAVKEVIEKTGELPPGVSRLDEVEFAVRSPTARKK